MLRFNILCGAGVGVGDGITGMDVAGSIVGGEIVDGWVVVGVEIVDGWVVVVVCIGGFGMWRLMRVSVVIGSGVFRDGCVGNTSVFISID